MPDTPLWRLSALQLSDLYARRETTPSEVWEATLARIGAVNPRLNALVAFDLDGARASARASTERWRTGTALSLLDGVPVSVKDNILMAGLPATWGSRLFADFVPKVDETPVARLRSAGAILFGKTNVPEFTLQGYTDNLLFGPTRNPYDLKLTPGGSSGGAVAAVAAGIGPLALGTDGGGSIRRPASHTGLVGFKPSRGRVPRADGFPAILLDFEVAGPIARTVADAEVMLGAIADGFRASRIDRPLRILFTPTFGTAPVDPAIAASTAEAAQLLKDRGHQVDTATPFVAAEPVGAIWPVISQTGLAFLLRNHPGAEAEIGAPLVEMARQGAAWKATDYLAALDGVAALSRTFAALFASYDLVLTPTAAALPWPVTTSHPETIAGVPVGPRGHAVFTPLANALGLPAVSVPVRPAPNGLPIGVQLIGAMGADALVLAAAAELEAQQLVPEPGAVPSL